MSKCLHAGITGARCNKPALKNPDEYNCPNKQYCPQHTYEDAKANKLDYIAHPKPINFTKLAKECGISLSIPVVSIDKSWFVKVDDMIKTLADIRNEYGNIVVGTQDELITSYDIVKNKLIFK